VQRLKSERKLQGKQQNHLPLPLTFLYNEYSYADYKDVLHSSQPAQKELKNYFSITVISEPNHFLEIASTVPSFAISPRVA